MRLRAKVEDAKKLSDFLSKASVNVNVVVMPDFYLDHFIALDASLTKFVSEVSRISRRGGGNWPYVSQYFLRGGNAANTASALARLGAQASLITRTSEFGAKMLELFLKPVGVDLSLVKSDGEAAITAALELKYRGRRVNVMINDPGSVADFGPERLSEEDVERICGADYVCVFNWSQNRRGTELAEHVFSLVKECGVGKTFFDTGDPTHKLSDVPEMVDRVLRRDLVDIFSLNENEAIHYATAADPALKRRLKEMPLPLAAREAASYLARELSSRIDLHTAEFSASFLEDEVFEAVALPVEPLRATGAGDAWNAGDIVGDALGLNHLERLLLANAVAAFYISDLEGRHPTLIDASKLLREAFG